MAIQKHTAPIPYTGSPLGIIDSFSEFQYNDNSGGKESIFTSYQNSKGQKHILKGNKGSVSVSILSSDTPHSNDVYDVSTKNVIKKLETIQHLKLNFADFAYLKDFGVYPNNRLIVARRFAGPVVDDLYSIPTDKGPGTPLSTMVGYFGEGDTLADLSFSFNEEWEESEISFKELLNELGKDFRISGQFELGTILEGGLNAIPLPGATQLFQRRIMVRLGIATENELSQIPQGDPNLIKESKSRSLIKEDSKGSGLTCKFNLTLKTKYEQKFINGVDPTIVFMDILNNALNMGTSVSTFYLGKQKDAQGRITKYLEEFTKDPVEKIKEFIESLIEAFKDVLKKLDESIKKAQDKSKSGESNIATDLTNLLAEAVESAENYVIDFIRAKYKIRFMGVITSLTGAPSTPWHITLGNPLRPIFCSGDMLCKSVDINFGPQLSFNDLPTYIEVSAKYESARNLGLQEIFSKFNTGGIRVTEGTYQGDYISGIADSFWNTKEGATQSISGSASTSQESQQTDNTEKTDNKTQTTNDNLSKVTPPTDTTSPTTSVDSDKSVSADPQSNDKITTAGANANTDAARTDNTQDMTGSTEGATDQMDSPDDKPYTGEDATTIPQEKNKTKWEVGKRVSMGKFSGGGLVVDWEVKKDATEGYYAGYVDGQETISGDDLNNVKEATIEDAKETFNSKSRQLGLTDGLGDPFLFE